MKRQISILVLLLLASIGFAQTQTQKGISYRYNGKNPRTPLSNVTVECVTANNAVKSDSTGSFTLTFNKLKMGDRIGLVTVKKREMMVFNQQAVDEWSIRKEPLCLILCDADEFDRQKKEYMDLGRKDAKRRYDREKAELEKQLKEGKIKQEDLENALNIAYERLERLQKEIDKYADDLARIDMSELDEKMQEILEMYQHGETEEAIKRLKSLKLAEEFDKETAHNEAIQQELQKSDNKLQTLVEQMKSSVALLKNSGEWEEAGKYLKRIADKTNNYDDAFAYAYFCAEQDNHEEAIEYYNRTLLLIDEDTNKDSENYQCKRAALLNNLGNLYNDARYYDTLRYMESEVLYLEALEIYKRLAKENPYYEEDVAMTLNNLADLYDLTLRETESETLYLEALEISRRLAKANPLAYEPNLASTLSHLASLYNDTHPTESEALYLEALEIKRRLAETNPQDYEPELALTLNGLALLYSRTQRYPESEALYLEALEIIIRLANDNPQAYVFNMDMVRFNLKQLYLLYKTQRYTECEALFLKALEIFRRVAKANPQDYEEMVAFTLYDIGLLHIQQDQYHKAIPVFEECLAFSRRLLALPYGATYYGATYIHSLYMLTQLYPLTKEHFKYYEVNEEWLPIVKTGYQKDTESYKELYVNALGSQSFQCIFVGQYEKSKQYAREALSIDSTQHWINTNLAAALLFHGKYAEAEAIYRQYKDELKDSFLQDLQDYETAGVIPKERKADVEKIRKILNE